jgi:hypothetical protein
MGELYAAIARSGASIPNVCGICKQPGSDSYAYIDQVYQQAHAACVHAYSNDAMDKAAENENSGSYVSGTVGALLGGLLGIVPSVLLATFFDRISWWLCALIPLGAYYGYKLLRGKMSGGMLGIIITISVIMAPIAQYFVDLGRSIREGWGVFSLIDYIRAFFIFPEDLVPSLLQFLLFIGIGFAFVYRIVSQGNTHMSGKASFAEASLRPIYPPGVENTTASGGSV